MGSFQSTTGMPSLSCEISIYMKRSYELCSFSPRLGGQDETNIQISKNFHLRYRFFSFCLVFNQVKRRRTVSPLEIFAAPALGPIYHAR